MTVSPRMRISVRVLQVVACAALAGYVFQAATSVCGAAVTNFFETYVYTALIAAAAALCLLRSAAVREERIAWLALGLGLVAWAAGETYYSLFVQELDDPPLLTPSDPLWLAFYPACYVAIGLFVRRRVRHFQLSLWLDGVVGALAAAALGTALIFGGIASVGDPTAIAIDTTYMLGDLLLIGFLIGAFAVTGWRPGRAWLLLGLGLAASAAVDAYFLYESATASVPGSTLLASLWPASALLVGFAAWQAPPALRAVQLDGLRLLAIPSGFALLTIGLLVYQTIHPLNGLAFGLAIGTLLAVIARMALTFQENLRLLERTRRESMTDALTGLGNRRRLMSDLEVAVADATPDDPRALFLFDLDGFKQYNDRYGHPVGDALLARLGRKLAVSVSDDGFAYRLGGDEFCVILTGGEERFSELEPTTSEAMHEQGEGFEVGASCGVVVIPHDAHEVTAALNIADERLYAHKGLRRRETVSRQTSDALLQAVSEREPYLRSHFREVARLAVAVGHRLGLAGEELENLERAAELHDVGKIAVPETILRKEGPLEGSDWDFIRQHTVVGDRILSAAPALQAVAKLVRASHERYDGLGYPDGVAGEKIPLAARIVAVCDAYHAMTSGRPYRTAVDSDEALAELRSCSGDQFDPEVVETFCDVVAEQAEAAADRRRGVVPAAVPEAARP
jgi:two-component system, cell cycle response regulator